MRGASTDAVLLTIVKVITMGLGIINTKIISVYFPLESYGLYSQALLIVNTATSFSILGLTDAVNFFYNNSASSPEEKERRLSNIFILQAIIGILCGIIIIVSGQGLCKYFNNPSLKSVFLWIAFQPLMQNLIPMLQVLYLSSGRSLTIVISNFTISIIRLAIFIVAALVTESILTIIAMTFICDILQVVFFTWDLNRHNIKVKWANINIKDWRPILNYAVPMAAFIIINSLMRDTDKWIVGYLGDTDELAIYTNCSRVLPFDMLTYSFALVLVPVITRYLDSDKQRVSMIFGEYLNLGAITTVILVIPALFLSHDFLLTLYSRQYLPGIHIFEIYLMVDLVRFANVSLLYNASGKTKELLMIIIGGFVLNAICAILTYKFLGFTGPAISTLCCMIMCYLVYMARAKRIIGMSAFSLINKNRVVLVLIETIVVGSMVNFVGKEIMMETGVIIRFLIFYSISIGILALINYKQIIRLMKSINSIANSNN